MRVALGVLAGLLLVSSSLAATSADYTGRIVDRVTCTLDHSQTYALYVPTNYTPARKWPVIFCFDPGARGRVPVERLQAAAEKYGFVLAGSLNSRNGPWEANATAIDAMVRDVETHLAIDLKRVYTAGLSGGARVAAEVALLGLAQGTILCSAGFPVSDDEIPSRIPFAVFGTTGTEDFNRDELWHLDEALDERKAAHRIVVFNGGHEWASIALLTEAVQWLELQAMKAGTRTKDDVLVRDFYAARLNALSAESGLEKWRSLKSLAMDFKGLIETNGLEKAAKDLSTTAALKTALKSERQAHEREGLLMHELADWPTYTSTVRVKKILTEVRALSAAPEDSPDRQMAKRVIAGFGSSGREATRTLFDRKNYTDAAKMLELVLELRPGQSRTLYDLARAQAGMGDQKHALENLTRAAEAGFSDATRTEAEPLFMKFRSEPAYTAATARMRSNPPEPAGRGRFRD